MKIVLSSAVLTVCLVAPCLIQAAQTVSGEVTVTHSIGKFPSKCPDAPSGTSGVCILTSTVPAASRGGFEVYTPQGEYVDDVYFNSFRQLAPGSYTVYNALDDQQGVPFTVNVGKLTTLRTGSVVNGLRRTVDVQTRNDDTTLTPTGSTQCVDTSFNDMGSLETYALLPGIYVIDADEPESENCTGKEITLSIQAGKGPPT